jgi:cell division septal protein FtsQ
MLGLRLRRIGEQLAKIPWVEKVRVRRYFPGSLVVEIREREPQAIAHMGYLYYLDGSGEPFKPLTVGDPLDYPVVTGVTEEDVARDPAGSREALRGALELMAVLKEGEALKLEEVSEIHFDKGFGYTLFALEKGVPVKLGNGEYREKLQRLSRIYRELQAQLPRVEYIDLDYSDKIIVKKT